MLIFLSQIVLKYNETLFPTLKKHILHCRIVHQPDVGLQTGILELDTGISGRSGSDLSSAGVAPAASLAPGDWTALVSLAHEVW